jgi:ABC-type glycerol-3-phosphate transport system substrate-binding protein
MRWRKLCKPQTVSNSISSFSCRRNATFLKEEEMSKKKLTRREFLSLSRMAGAGAVLAACGAPTAALAAAPTAAPATAPAAAPIAALAVAATPADLRFVWWGGQLRADVTTQVIKMFETKHPNLKFTFEPLGFDKYWAKMTTGVIDLSNVPKVLQTHSMIDGKMYGVSAGTNATGFVVDTDAFKKAGIKVPADTWTSTDFEHVVKELHTKLGIWGFGMFLHHMDHWRVLSLMSLGDCSCISCRTKRRHDRNLIARQPTVLQQYFQHAA